MTKEEVIQEFCSIMAMVYRSIGEYNRPSDGFCEQCQKLQGNDWNYQNDGHILEFVRKAVLEKMKRKNISIHPGWDKKGNEIPHEEK